MLAISCKRHFHEECDIFNSKFLFKGTFFFRFSPEPHFLSMIHEQLVFSHSLFIFLPLCVVKKCIIISISFIFLLSLSSHWILHKTKLTLSSKFFFYVWSCNSIFCERKETKWLLIRNKTRNLKQGCWNSC